MSAPLYVDTSALAKLLFDESEGPALKTFLEADEYTLVSSELTEVELVRATSRLKSTGVQMARELLRGIVLLPISTSVRELAGELFPGKLRSLDAIHLSTALEIKADLAGLLTYDNRMTTAARESGLTTFNPHTD